MDLGKVNRVAIVTPEAGRMFDVTGVTVSLDLQDDGRTLKLFIRHMPLDEAAAARHQHNQELGEALITAARARKPE